ncbi:MAG: cysteine--tRNA ligase [Candidatus Omnitrophica bacterium]|nr:cysteine--tRNA ligase [Candidatus Omnitrophota bacterium]
MPIFIYNSLSRKKEEFKSLEPQKIKMYVCGPTVYDQPHIGHARSAYIFDVIRRYLIYKDYKVTFVRNVTDVDDKIIDKARQEYPGEDLNSAVQKTAKKYLDAYHEDMRQLGILDPDVEPKATEYIPQMQKFIEELIKRGAAYPAGGDVYFDIKKAKDYGKLSHQAIDKMESGARIAPGEKKKDPLDFALWKAAKENEPFWDSPWGKGRPGWHIECSVMSSDILGNEFDIHGGGLDLIFPHHENEIAQSEGAGKKFARYWLHHGLLTINGQKMSKSLGNFVTVKDFLSKYPSDVLKFFFLGVHYTQPIDFTWDKIQEKQKALYRLITFLKYVGRREGGKGFIVKTDLKNKISAEELLSEIKEATKNFDKAMDDDFNTSNALAVIFEMVRSCDKILYDVSYTEEYLPILKEAKQLVEKLGKIFGVSFKESLFSIPDEDIKRIIDIREGLKKQKLFKEADSLRSELEEKGIILEDSKDGTTWRRKL